MACACWKGYTKLKEAVVCAQYRPNWCGPMPSVTPKEKGVRSFDDGAAFSHIHPRMNVNWVLDDVCGLELKAMIGKHHPMFTAVLVLPMHCLPQALQPCRELGRPRPAVS